MPEGRKIQRNEFATISPPAGGEGGPQAEKKERLIENVIFHKKRKGGKVVYESSDRSRKLIVFKSGSSAAPEEDIPYTVRVEHDTNPENQMVGKLIVVLAEEDVPMVRETARLRESAIPFPIEEDSGGNVYVLDTRIERGQGGPLVPSPARFRHFTLDEDTLEVIDKVATAVERREPCLLEGETSTSKTSTIEYLAMRTNHQIFRMNMNGQTDTSEFIGKFVPNDGNLQISFEELLRNPQILSANSREILAGANKEGRGMTLVESQKIAQAEGLKISDWKWQDGIDVRAKKEGGWLILDEINLAEPQILERLNSQLEKHPSITLSENGGMHIRELDAEEAELYRNGQLEGIVPLHPEFRIFSTENPADYSGRHVMSPAYKDRWTSYKFVGPPTERGYKAMMELMVYGEQPSVTFKGQVYAGESVPPLMTVLREIPNFRGFMEKLAKFQVKVEDLARRREIGKSKKERYIFTRRGLIEFLGYLESKVIIDRKTRKSVSILDDPKTIILRALQYYYLDKISDPDDLRKVMDQLEAIGISERKWTHQFTGQNPRPRTGTRHFGTPPPASPGRRPRPPFPGAVPATPATPEAGKESLEKFDIAILSPIPEEKLSEAAEIVSTSTGLSPGFVAPIMRTKGPLGLSLTSVEAVVLHNTLIEAGMDVDIVDDVGAVVEVKEGQKYSVRIVDEPISVPALMDAVYKGLGGRLSMSEVGSLVRLGYRSHAGVVGGLSREEADVLIREIDKVGVRAEKILEESTSVLTREQEMKKIASAGESIQGEYGVRIVSGDISGSKLAAIKVVRDVLEVNLQIAKAMVDAAMNKSDKEGILAKNLSARKANELMAALHKIGAVVELVETKKARFLLDSGIII